VGQSLKATPQGNPDKTQKPMLKTRIITALALLPPVLGLLIFAPPWLWALAVAAVCMIGLWEWSRFCGFGRTGMSAYLAVAGLIVAALFAQYVWAANGFTQSARVLFWASLIFWLCVALPWLLRQARPGPLVCAAAGLAVVVPTWVALVVLRDAGGPLLPLAAMLLVWVADVAAYFAGKRFGRTKLAPAISPGKTWQGVYGALVGVSLYALAVAFFAPGMGIKLNAGAVIWLPLAALLLTALSVIGDLFESWMKRGVGLKDSSNLLPGHGGVMDRIDALTPVLPAVALMLPWVG
jgi:phosphatidate cytidylyltransferase